MQDIVGDRLKKQIHARRKDRMYNTGLWLFLIANISLMVYELIKKFCVY